MAVTRNVTIKRRGEWKPLSIDSFKDEEGLFEGLSGIETLTEYELVVPNKKRKLINHDTRKNISEDIAIENDVKEDSESNSPQAARRKKKRKKQKVVKHKEVGTLDHDENTMHVDMSDWQNMFLPEPVERALERLRYTSPTTIQMLTLPSAIRDRMDIVGAAETGSGKTLAFGIPLVHHVLRIRQAERENTGNEDTASTSKEITEEARRCNSRLYALVLTPTRELAIQIKNHLQAICKFTDINIAAVLGGMAVHKQERLLRKCPEIVIATPGRLWELIQERNPYLTTVTDISLLVIDEADRMLEKGHFTELACLLELINRDEEKVKKRQNFVFSATLTFVHDVPNRMWMKKKKKKLTANDKLNDLMAIIGIKDRPKTVDITRKFGTAELLQEARINCPNDVKDLYLYYFLIRHPGRTLVFCNSIDCVRRINNVFTLLARNPVSLHASMHQKQRLKNLEKFSANDKGLLLATDVAARGLDIPNIEHVIHYQVPRTSESYVHRSGRTARATREGLSVMLVDPEEVSSVRKLCRTLNRNELLPLFPVDETFLKKLQPTVNIARDLDVKMHRWKRANNESNWLKKTVEEMDLDLDDDELTMHVGDKLEQSQREKEINGLQKSLRSLLKKDILPHKFSLRYPTMGGKLPTLDVEAKEKAIFLVKKEKLNNTEVNEKRKYKKKLFFRRKGKK